MKTSTDVLVVGAGPVGLLLACELQRFGVDYLLIEKAREHTYFCKALGVTPRTLEILHGLGIADEAIEAGVWMSATGTFENGIETESEERSLAELPYGFLALPQYETERLLENLLGRLGGRAERGVSLESFAGSATQIQANVRAENGTAQTISCRWMVGCDGARSTVRKGLGLEFTGEQYPMTFMLGDVELDWNLPRGRFYRFRQTVDGQVKNGMVAVPIRGSIGRYRLSMGAPESLVKAQASLGAEAAVPPTLEQLAQVAGPMLPQGVCLSNLRWSSVYRISHRIVPQYSVGPIFLAGDAAHIHPPIGGQGMNTGLQDAHNLSWKLALVAKGMAAEELLESYSAERYPVGVDVVEQTSRAMQTAMSSGSIRGGGEARDSQIYISYRNSAWVRDDVAAGTDPENTPQAGDRAPDATDLSRPFVAYRTRLRDRLERGRHVLIGYSAMESAAADCRGLAELEKQLQTGLGGLVDGLAVLAPASDIFHSEQIATVTDVAGSFREAYGARPGMVWLVRPDGYLAWRSDRAHGERLGSLLQRLHLRKTHGP